MKTTGPFRGPCLSNVVESMFIEALCRLTEFIVFKLESENILTRNRLFSNDGANAAWQHETVRGGHSIPVDARCI